jgi:hypothetical protein
MRLQVVWLASCWYSWKERNNEDFALKNISIAALVDKVKVLSQWWLKSRKKAFNCMLQAWLTNPLAFFLVRILWLVWNYQ